MEEWKEYKLGELLTIKYGKDHKKLGDGNIPVYGSGGLMRHVNQSIFDGPSILIPRKGSLNNILYSDKPFWCVDTMFWSIINDSIVNPKFLYYSIFKKDFSSLNVGTAVPSLTVPVIDNIDVLIPSLKTQDNIVSIISSLDSKIENNRKINENLEQQAQALFKSWFVDFEPFRDQPFVDSELGPIPQGWRVGCYEEIIESIIAGDWGKENETGNYTHKVACIRGCDFQDIKYGLRGKTPVRYILEKNYQNKHFRDKDILVEISGGTQFVSTGRICPISQSLIDKFNKDIVCTNFCKLIRPVSIFSAFLYYSWLYKYNCKVMFGYENGTSGIKNFLIKDFISKEPILIPSLEVAYKFQEMIDSIQIMTQKRGSESQTLAKLRDTLLPKLMSGEIKV